MADAHLDHPGEVTWFAGYGPRQVVGPCPHGCPHSDLGTVAWGPDHERYSLVECRTAAGCAGRCRAWTTEYPSPFSAQRPKFRLRTFAFLGGAE